jgi:WYL domain-containing protein
METIATTPAIDYKNLIEQTNGKLFVVEFAKKDGQLRRLVGRLEVERDLKGKGLAFDPSSRGLLSVFDIQAKGYRFINLATVSYFRCGQCEAGQPRLEVLR